jgi:predicted metal-dependent hydrolase
LENWLADFAQDGGLDPRLGRIALCLRGYVECFNRAEYYEAHDVLEHAWLELPRAAPEWAFLKGMIQLAGGFVHLRLHYLEPTHRVHGRRLGPAAKLFRLAEENLAGQAALAENLGLKLEDLRGMIRAFTPKETETNPWAPERAPRVSLQTGGN